MIPLVFSSITGANSPRSHAILAGQVLGRRQASASTANNATDALSFINAHITPACRSECNYMSQDILVSSYPAHHGQASLPNLLLTQSSRLPSFLQRLDSTFRPVLKLPLKLPSLRAPVAPRYWVICVGRLRSSSPAPPNQS